MGDKVFQILWSKSLETLIYNTNPHGFCNFGLVGPILYYGRTGLFGLFCLLKIAVDNIFSLKHCITSSFVYILPFLAK